MHTMAGIKLDKNGIGLELGWGGWGNRENNFFKLALIFFKRAEGNICSFNPSNFFLLPFCKFQKLGLLIP